MSHYPVLENVELYRQAKAIREWLCEISGRIPRLNEDPNPFYGNVEDGLTLIEYYAGPSGVGTPYGEWTCTGGGLTTEGWREQAISRLGLELFLPETETPQGIFGPVWKITKDLDGNPLPEVKGRNYAGFPGVRGASYLATLNVSPEQIMHDITTRLANMREEATAMYFNGGSEDYAMVKRPSIENYHYDLYRVMWHEIKKQIGHVAWDDRVDPELFPVQMYSVTEVNTLLHKVGATGAIDVVRGTEVFSVIDRSKNPQYVLHCDNYKHKILNVIGANGNAVTPELITRMYVLLAARGYKAE